MEVLCSVGYQGEDLSGPCKKRWNYTLGLSPAQLCSADITVTVLALESLSFRAAGIVIPLPCQLVGMHCNLHLGGSPSPCPQIQHVYLRMGPYKHLSKRPFIAMSSGAPGADLGRVDPVASSSCCSERNFSLRYGRRLCSLGGCQGYILQEMGFCRVEDPLANSQL